jgi:hypothetical protein
MSYKLFECKLYSTEEAGEALGLEPVQVKRLLNAGHLYGEKFNNQWLIPEMAITAFRYIQAEREKIDREVSKLERILNEFVERGDISKTHFEKSMALLTEFLGNGQG